MYVVLVPCLLFIPLPFVFVSIFILLVLRIYLHTEHTRRWLDMLNHIHLGDGFFVFVLGLLLSRIPATCFLLTAFILSFRTCMFPLCPASSSCSLFLFTLGLLLGRLSV
eukprot:GHVQ01010621.1.p1 GENE.GHVQ01010621.1~~GHVQ01010621.1.p1  ORF type:complete len:109 (+),score=6.65 GHVQ01010621.1:233-559(+)